MNFKSLVCLADGELVVDKKTEGLLVLDSVGKLQLSEERSICSGNLCDTSHYCDSYGELVMERQFVD